MPQSNSTKLTRVEQEILTTVGDLGVATSMDVSLIIKRHVHTLRVQLARLHRRGLLLRAERPRPDDPSGRTREYTYCLPHTLPDADAQHRFQAIADLESRLPKLPPDVARRAIWTIQNLRRQLP